MKLNQSHRYLGLLVMASLLFYFFFAYYLERSDFSKLFLLYTALFFLCYKIINKTPHNFTFLFGAGIVFRIVFLLALPNLSQDYFRFIWDGNLLIQGINPYLFTPNSLALSQINGFATQDLISGMGTLNASNYSNYPPVLQFCYAIAALLGGKSILGSVIVLRLVLIAADIGTLLFGRKLLKKLNLPKHTIFWYFLNPFVIIELTGNLHFEGVMVFFLVASLYFLISKKWLWSAVFLALSISTKLIPLLFLPLFLPYFKNQFQPLNKALLKLSSYYLTVFALMVLLFAPFISKAFIENFTATISLYFTNFEFNASLYYLIRWVGYQTVGWNIIDIAGKVLAMLVIVFVLSLSFFRTAKTSAQLKVLLLFSSSFYLLLSTTVHPWYLCVPLVLSVFTKYRFMLVWSYMIVLSYSAYGSGGFQENFWLVGLEYLVVIGYFIWEVNRNKPLKNTNNSSVSTLH